MRRHKWKLLAALAVLVLAGLVGFVLSPRTNPFQSQYVSNLKEGMTRAEIEAMLGGPPGDYRTGPTRAVAGFPSRLFPAIPRKFGRRSMGDWGTEDRVPRLLDERDDDWNLPQARSTAKWEGDSVEITVGFDDFERAVWGEYVLASRVEQSPFGLVIWRLRRQWDRWFP